MTVRFEKVDKKRKSWSAMKSNEQRQAIREELFSVVKGPADDFYILDHHHTAAALVKEKSRLGGTVLKEWIMQVRDANRNPQRLLP